MSLVLELKGPVGEYWSWDSEMLDPNTYIHNFKKYEKECNCPDITEEALSSLFHDFQETEKDNQKYDGARLSLDYAESPKQGDRKQNSRVIVQIKCRDFLCTLTAMKHKVSLFEGFQTEIMQLVHLSNMEHSKALMRKKRKNSDADSRKGANSMGSGVFGGAGGGSASGSVVHCNKRSASTMQLETWLDYEFLENSAMPTMRKNFQTQKNLYREAHFKNISEMNKILATCSPTMKSALYYGVGE